MEQVSNTYSHWHIQFTGRYISIDNDNNGDIMVLLLMILIKMLMIMDYDDMMRITMYGHQT